MPPEDPIAASLRDIKTSLKTLVDGQADLTQRVIELERARPEHASRADVAEGDLKAASAIVEVHDRVGKLYARLDQSTYLQERAAESRTATIVAGIVALGIVVVVGALVAVTKVPPDAFVPTVAGIGAVFAAWVGHKRRERKTELGASIPPQKG